MVKFANHRKPKPTGWLVFYNVWIKAVDRLPEKEQLLFWSIIHLYGCQGIEPSEDKMSVAMLTLWEMIKNQIDEDKERRRDKIENQRQYAKNYRERRKNDDEKTKETKKTKKTLNSSTHDCVYDCDCDCEGDCEGDCVSGINSLNDNLSNQNITTTTTSKDIVDCDGVVGVVVADFSSKKKRVINQTTRK